MYVVYLAGGIASGKSTVAREMEALGARRCDLDQVSRDVLAPGMPCTLEVADVFGDDLIDPDTGALDRRLLALRAFSSSDDIARLEAIELPHIRDALVEAIDGVDALERPDVMVVEIPLLDRMGGLLDLADEVVCVTCPLDLRERRAVGRGMSALDFRGRAANQPTDEWLAEHADTVFDNRGDRDELLDAVRTWWDEREREGWSGGH